MWNTYYRLNQFRRAHREFPTKEGLAQAREILSPKLFDLFSRLLPFEQAHSIQVMNKLADLGHHDPDLLIAALLHDVGKSSYPLRPWERGFAVIAETFLPSLYRKWAEGRPTGLRTGVVVAARHAEWGAELAAEAGANERIIWFIRHHDADLQEVEEADRAILNVLQIVDAAN